MKLKKQLKKARKNPAKAAKQLAQNSLKHPKRTAKDAAKVAKQGAKNPGLVAKQLGKVFGSKKNVGGAAAGLVAVAASKKGRKALAEAGIHDLDNAKQALTKLGAKTRTRAHPKADARDEIPSEPE